MQLVVIESPYAGDTKANLEYAHQCVADCLKRGESPYASHIMLTTALDDAKKDQRKLGIEAGLYWTLAADFVVVYIDKGISPGMVDAIEHHERKGKLVKYRSIHKDKLPYQHWSIESVLEYISLPDVR